MEQFAVLIDHLRTIAYDRTADAALPALLQAILAALHRLHKAMVESQQQNTEQTVRMMTTQQLTLVQAVAMRDERIRDLSLRCKRLESYRKALVYQKRYLVLLLGGFEETEDVMLAMIAAMGAKPSLPATPHNQVVRTKLRGALMCVRAAARLGVILRSRARLVGQGRA